MVQRTPGEGRTLFSSVLIDCRFCALLRCIMSK